MNIAACIGAILGPVIIGSFTQHNRLNGWRNFYVCVNVIEALISPILT